MSLTTKSETSSALLREDDDGLAAHVAHRAPDLYITFLSILVGIVLADLLQLVRNDLRFWPIDARAVMTSAQIVGMAGSALGTWAVYAHLAIAQRQTPRFSESLAAFVGPLVLLVANSFVGAADPTAWFLLAGIFLTVATVASTASVLNSARPIEGRAFRRMLRPGGFLLVLAVGAPSAFAAAALVKSGLVGPWGAAAMACATVPAAMLLPVLYFRDWRRALREGPRAPAERPTPSRGDGSITEGWVREKVSDVFITLISITIGLALQEMVDQARDRMTLWPLDSASLMTWGQIGGVVSSGLSAWLIYGHLAISRRGLPSYAETLSGAVAPMFLAVASGLTGRAEVWPWLYAGAAYLALQIFVTRLFTRFAESPVEKALLVQVGRPSGYTLIMLIGAPVYALIGLGEQFGFLPQWLVLCAVLASGPAGMLCAWMFFRDWRKALAA